jgi:hypothetical protein
VSRTMLADGMRLWNLRYLTMNEAGTAIYTWNGASAEAYSGRAVAKRDLDSLDVTSYARSEVDRSALIDEAFSGTTWHGDMNSLTGAGSSASITQTVGSGILVDSDSIFISGTYANSYTGSAPAGGNYVAAKAGYVARYSLDGTRIWFKEYAFPKEDILQGQVPVTLANIIREKSGDLIILASDVASGFNGLTVPKVQSSYLFAVARADGSLLPQIDPD